MRSALSIVLAGAVVLGVAGCGGGSTSAGNPPPSTRSTGSAPTAVSPSAPTSSPRPTKSTPPSNVPTEFNPPGDIPDNQVFVPYRATGRLLVKVPEGWGRTTSSGVTTFSDHFNSISIQVVRMPNQPTIASIRRTEIPWLRQHVNKLVIGPISPVHLGGGTAFLVKYQHDSSVDPVTGKVIRDASQRFDFWHQGYEGIVTLTGPTNADNVDPWRLVSQSVRWLR